MGNGTAAIGWEDEARAAASGCKNRAAHERHGDRMSVGAESSAGPDTIVEAGGQATAPCYGFKGVIIIRQMPQLPGPRGTRAKIISG